MSLPQWLNDLVARRAAICNELASLSASQAGGKPNNGSEGGGTDHVGYKDGLYRELSRIDKLLKENGVSPSGNATSGEVITEAWA